MSEALSSLSGGKPEGMARPICWLGGVPVGFAKRVGGGERQNWQAPRPADRSLILPSDPRAADGTMHWPRMAASSAELLMA